MNTHKNFLRVGVSTFGGQAMAHFKLLEAQKAAIEGDFGTPLEWEELPKRTECRIAVRKFDADLTDKDRWPVYQEWMIDQMNRFDRVFRPLIKELNADDYRPDAAAAGQVLGAGTT